MLYEPHCPTWRININKVLNVSKVLTKGKCGETCQWIYDSEEKILYVYGNGEISQFDDMSDTIIIRPEAQSAEEIFDIALDLLKTGEVGLLIFDSIAI